MGADYFGIISGKYHKPQVISGYEPENVLKAILHLVLQVNNKTATLENLFPEAVSGKREFQITSVARRGF